MTAVGKAISSRRAMIVRIAVLGLLAILSAAIAGFIDLLSEYVDRPKAVGYLQSISGSANHLLQLVSALLDYHKLESGKAERHEVSFQPTALVSECVAQMQPLAMAKQLRLATDINVAEDMFCPALKARRAWASDSLSLAILCRFFCIDKAIVFCYNAP